MCMGYSVLFWVPFWVTVVFTGGYALGRYHERSP